jgi:hypothetical protein
MLPVIIITDSPSSLSLLEKIKSKIAIFCIHDKPDKENMEEEIKMPLKVNI